MLGWELPPHNSGGLGVACLQLCKALSKRGIDIEFILPYRADHGIDFMKVTSATPFGVAEIIRSGVAYDSHKYVFTDGHAEMDISDFYEDLANLKEIDWDIMKATYWRDTNEDNDRKRRRQAEFLVHNTLPWHCMTEVGVISPKVAAVVTAALATVAHKPTVAVHRDWYY